MDKVRDQIQKPYRHLQSFFEPEGTNYLSQSPDTYRMHGNSMMHFTASITSNSFDMNQWHEMEATVHSQFGTVDNPVLIFTSDSSWRIVVCMGPGIEDDSHAHEKMYYLAREGPINRCQVCGQCFKIVRLKDEASELNDYYSMMFAQITHFELSEEDSQVNLTSLFGDRPQFNWQTAPSNNIFIQINSDEADRILVDPAYKLEKLKEAHEAAYAMNQAYRACERQMDKQKIYFPIPFGKDLYESWYKIEQSISKFDRIFAKVEKFDKRKFSQPEHHERREKRMLERKRERWTNNYTYFFGGLTEEEQMYRDYFETDLEGDPEIEEMEQRIDDGIIAADEQFQFRKYEFVESSFDTYPHENYEDILEKKIFKFKYRQCNDRPDVYLKRQSRLVKRFFDRAAVRDPVIEQNLVETVIEDEVKTSLAQAMLDGENYQDVLYEKTRPIREYIAKEACQQYIDYYESDEEEQKFIQHIGNMSNRERIRMMEIYLDPSYYSIDTKEYVTIPKREFNPSLSVFSNLILDLQDFKDRVRPLAKDIALIDQSRKYQRANVETLMKTKVEIDKQLHEVHTEFTERIEASTRNLN